MQLRLVVHRMEDRVARAIGLSPDRRGPLIVAMLAPRTGEAVGYWLQLLMAGALATLGLALNSTAVVIGAMLIAPLMRPIVELAMGLATGSAPLVFRAGARAVASTGAVVAAAAVITWLLPFHEVTSELVARTGPSMLDLFVAAACALVGAYATMFSAGDMATTAAGTSIGISLVPPLCTLGYGIATGDRDMAIGAGLLFTANITGILLVASLVFVLVGFGQVSSAEPDADGLAQDLASRMGRGWLQQSRRLGAISRLLLPVLLLAVIYLPLRRAVGDMSARSAIRSEVGAMLTDSHVAQSAIEFDAAGAFVRVVIVGDAKGAKELEARLVTKLASLGETSPRVSVWAVPDASSVGALTRRLDALPPPRVEEPPRILADRPVRDIASAITAAWPTSSAGELVAMWVASAEPLRIRVVHLGAPVGSAGMHLLATAIAPTEKLAIEEDALAPAEAPSVEAARWLPLAFSLVDRAARHDLWVCITTPAPPEPDEARPKPDKARPKSKPVEDPTIAEVRKLIEAHVADRPKVVLGVSDRWSIVAKRVACEGSLTPPEDPKESK